MVNASITDWLDANNATVDAALVKSSDTHAWLELRASNGEARKFYQQSHDGTAKGIKNTKVVLNLEQSEVYRKCKLTPFRNLNTSDVLTVSKYQKSRVPMAILEAYQIRAQKITASHLVKHFYLSMSLVARAVVRVGGSIEDINLLYQGEVKALLENKLKLEMIKATAQTAMPKLYEMAVDTVEEVSVRKQLERLNRLLTDPESDEARAFQRVIAIIEPFVANPLKVDSPSIIALSLRDLCQAFNEPNIDSVIKKHALAGNCNNETTEYINSARFVGGLLSHAIETGIIAKSNAGQVLAQKAYEVESKYNSNMRTSGITPDQLALEEQCASDLKVLKNLPEVAALAEWYASTGKDILNTPIDEGKTLKHPYGRAVRMKDEREIRYCIAQASEKGSSCNPRNNPDNRPLGR